MFICRCAQGTLKAFGILSEAAGGIYGDALSDYDKLTHIKAVKGCMGAGVSLYALENPLFRDFFDHVKVSLPGRQHLGKHVTFIVEEEVRR